jgi:predicted metal-dependent phosphoesterase TrpH
LIDLHLHTSASDGLLAPDELVRRAARAGLTTISITDHDTVAGIPYAGDAARRGAVRIVPGIEITSIEDGRDVHILGYFIDVDSAALAEFLRDQRADRLRRVREIGQRLHALGFSIDVESLLAAGPGSSRSVGRPAIADALVAAGHAADRNDAFARLLGRGRPGFVPRQGVPARSVVQVIHAAGGIASLAHPGVTGDDVLIPALVDAGLDAIEVWHSDHTIEHQRHYAALADRLNLAKSGGSDYHGEGVHRACQLGAVTLPDDEFKRLEQRAESQ